MSFALYLTGIPAVGKSTVAQALEAAAGAVRYSYGDLLSKRLANTVSSQRHLREMSAEVITPEDVLAVDNFVCDELSRLKGLRNAVVDSHALTAEAYGLRAVPYGARDLARFPYTHIVCLTAPEDTVRERIRVAADGRRLQDQTDFHLHQSLQSTLALTYAVMLAVPVAFVRADRETADIVEDISGFVSVT